MKYQVQGKISTLFQGYSDKVAKQVGHQHTGQDEYKGWLQPWFFDNNTYIYKVFDDRYPNWQAAYGIVKDGDKYYEIVEGHFRHLGVQEGDYAKAGQVAGFEGNAGQVYSNGRKVTDKEKLNGSTAGDHNHRGIRPVERVKKTKKGEHYLRDSKGNLYKDEEMCYYRIIHKDNGAKGWVDPMQFAGPASKMKKVAYKLRQEGKYNQAAIVEKVANMSFLFE